MSLDSENRKAIVEYRTEKAALALEDADFLTNAGKYNLFPKACHDEIPEAHRYADGRYTHRRSVCFQFTQF